MDTIEITHGRPRTVRLAAAFAAALLALTAGLVAATPVAPSAAAEDPPTGLTWKMSDQAWTSGSLSPAHTTAAPATKGADGFVFPEVADVAVDAFTGAASATFPGSFDLGNFVQGNYRIRVAAPTVTIAPGRASGTLDAAVSFALFDNGTQTHVWTTPATTRVADLTFAPGTIVDTGSNISFTVTPDFVLRSDLTPEANPGQWKQFPQPLLDLLAQATPPLHGHFRQTADNQTAKAPAPLAISFPYTPNAPPTGLTWRMSQQAWTSGSLAPAHATDAPAVKQDEGFVFPTPTEAFYDPHTGDGQIDFTGSFVLGNTNQGNYRIKIADPSVVIDGAETGDLTADVSFALFDNGTQTHVWTTASRITVADLTFPDGSITIDGDQLSFIVTPDFVLRSDLTPEANPGQWKQFPQPLLDLLAQATPPLHGHFRQTADNQTAKAPAPLGVNVTVDQPTASERLVQALYRGMFARSAGDGELDYWAGRLDGGADPEVVVTAMARSTEGRRRLVRLGYAATLDRNPGTAEIDYWAGRLASGLTPELLVVQLLASPEALAAWGGTPDGLAEGGYQVFLHRSGDPGGITYWGDRLEAAGGVSGRGVVLKAFGRTAAATKAAIADAFLTGCGIVPTQEPSENAFFESVWAAYGHNPLILIGATVVTICPTGPEVD